jgi:hypothetical protein
VLVCKQHRTGVVNLNKHLLEHHATPAALRGEIVERFIHFARTEPNAVELPEPPAHPIEELGSPLDGLKCKTCDFVTINTNRLRMHCRKNHQQAWTGDKSVLYESVKVQTFFSSGGLQRYFIVDLGVSENEENLDRNQIVENQLNTWLEVREQLNEDMDVMEDAAKTDKTGWFKRAGWLEFFKDRNLVHLAHQARLPDRNEVKLQAAAQLTEQLIESCVKGLATLPQETRRWLRSARQTEVDQRPLARLQNPESQATYASYMVRFVCFYLRVIADEAARVEEYLSQRDQVVDSSEESSSEDASIESECDDADSNDNDNDSDSVVPQRRPQKKAQTDKMKDARALFSWKED